MEDFKRVTVSVTCFKINDKRDQWNSGSFIKLDILSKEEKITKYENLLIYTILYSSH